MPGYDGDQSRVYFRQAGLRLGGDKGVAFAVILTAFGMSHDHIGSAGVLQHLGGEVAGEGAFVLGMTILSAQGESAFPAHAGLVGDQGGWRTDQTPRRPAG